MMAMCAVLGTVLSGTHAALWWWAEAPYIFALSLALAVACTVALGMLCWTRALFPASITMCYAICTFAAAMYWVCGSNILSLGVVGWAFVVCSRPTQNRFPPPPPPWTLRSWVAGLRLTNNGCNLTDGG